MSTVFTEIREAAVQCKIDRLKKQVAHWHAKFSVVKRENNQLRQKIKARDMCILGLTQKL